MFFKRSSIHCNEILKLNYLKLNYLSNQSIFVISHSSYLRSSYLIFWTKIASTSTVIFQTSSSSSPSSTSIFPINFYDEKLIFDLLNSFAVVIKIAAPFSLTLGYTFSVSYVLGSLFSETSKYIFLLSKFFLYLCCYLFVFSMKGELLMQNAISKIFLVIFKDLIQILPS